MLIWPSLLKRHAKNTRVVVTFMWLTTGRTHFISLLHTKVLKTRATLSVHMNTVPRYSHFVLMTAPHTRSQVLSVLFFLGRAVCRQPPLAPSLLWRTWICLRFPATSTSETSISKCRASPRSEGRSRGVPQGWWTVRSEQSSTQLCGQRAHWVFYF